MIRIHRGTTTATSSAAMIAGALGLSACGSAPPPARLGCEAMHGHRIAASDIALPTGGAVVREAVMVAAAPATPKTQAVVAHCKLVGEILPVDPAAAAIRFQLNVPDAWNGSAIQVGGGGLNGSIPRNLAAIGDSGSPVSAAQPPDATYPINRGYAMFGGDSGHQGTDGRWALNNEARLNFAHASLKKTHDAAVALLRARHGRAPRFQYFMGTSQGGREALEVAQRYPADYDGVVAAAPLVGYSAHVIHKTVLAGQQTGAAWIPPELTKAVADEVMRQYDALDGIADGVVSHQLGCNARFDPAPLRCPGDQAGTTCLSDAQMGTLKAMHAPLDFGYALANGWTRFPGYGTGREAVAWLNIKPQPKPGLAPALGQPGTTVQYVILQDPAADLLQFSVASARDRIVAASALIDSTNPDLSDFFARGGRLIVKSNGADYFVNPQTAAEWMKRVRDRMGNAAVDAHVRHYLRPGAGHSGDGKSHTTGAPIPQYVDLISMMTDWVERDLTPPEASVLRSADGATKPMCRYPLYPRHVGGDPAPAESYRCVRG